MSAKPASEPLVALYAAWQRADLEHCAACDRDLETATANAAGATSHGRRSRRSRRPKRKGPSAF